MDIVPPLKGVTDTVREIADLVTNFRTCTDEWKEFLLHIQSAVKISLQPINSIHGEQSEVKAHILTLQGTLDGIVKRIEARQKESFLVKLGHFRDHSIVIDEMRREVDNALELFKLGIQSWTGINVEKLVQATAARDLDPLLSKLRYISGASWDKQRVCLPNTRQHIIDKILDWINSPADGDSGTTIFLLTGVAGSGKSAISHTISQRLYETNQLATSFFFDRETAERNNPRWLISTIVFDLCQRNDLLARRITAAIEEDKGLIGAPISRQFQQLILDPSQAFTCSSPLVIVLDALDEGFDHGLLQILRDDACKLPPSIRIVLTSRMSPEVDSLRRKSHVRSTELDIYNQDSLDDITLFISSKLREVADFHGLGDDWPDQQLLASFQARAEGLFLWVSTTCTHLEACYYPTKELQKLVSGSFTDSSAESKMDSLYIAILQTCKWDDREFADSCHTLLGATVASKSPLTLCALNKLFGRVIMDSDPALRQLSPLLTGLNNKPGSSPVRFLHQSLRDFLTLRATGANLSPMGRVFSVHEREHSKTFGLLCLKTMNHQLRSDMPGVGYCLDYKLEPLGIPVVKEETLSEELLYACRFWIDHVMDIEFLTSSNESVQLEQLLTNKLVPWMELTAAYGRYEGLSKAQLWATDALKDVPSLRALFTDENLATVSHNLAQRLQYMDRREEALLAAQDEVSIYRNIASSGANEPRAKLARALYSLSIYLSELALHEDAFAAASEAVGIQRELLASGCGGLEWDLSRSLWRQSVGYSSIGRHDNALIVAREVDEIQRHSIKCGGFTSNEQKNDLAKNLRSLSECFVQLGRYKEALEASTEEVKVHRELLAEEPLLFKPDLARSLLSLTSCHWYLNEHPEMLAIAQEAVDLSRELAKERPATFLPNFAKSLSVLALALSEVGRHNEALSLSQEAVDLHRRLAKQRPAVFNPDLAKSLLNLSGYLSDIGQHDEALAVDQETVELRRQLAKERPAVFTRGFAKSLYNLSVGLSTLGRDDEALVMNQEALEIRQRLFEQRPEVFARDLADSLYCHSCILSKLDRHDEAEEFDKAFNAMGISIS